MSTGGPTDPVAANEEAADKMNAQRKAHAEEKKRKKAEDKARAQKLEEVQATLTDTVQAQSGTVEELKKQGDKIIQMRETQDDTLDKAKKSEKELHDQSTIFPTLPDLHLLNSDKKDHEAEYKHDVAAASNTKVVTPLFDSKKKKNKTTKPKANSDNNDLDAAIKQTAELALKNKVLATNIKGLVKDQDKQLKGLGKDIATTIEVDTKAEHEVEKLKKKKKGCCLVM